MIWNSQEKRTPMNKTLRGNRAISEASAFDQWWEVMGVGGVSPTSVVIGLDPTEDGLTNRIPLHAGAVQAVDQFLLQHCEKTLHARVVETAMRTAHTLAYGAEPGDHRPVFPTGILATVVGRWDQSPLIPIAWNCVAQCVAAQVGIHLYPKYAGVALGQ